MAFCESCGKPLREGARFCGACGATAPQDLTGETPSGGQIGSGAWSCPACTTENQADSLFCSHCGAGRGAAVPQANESATAVLPPAVTSHAAEAAAAPGADSQSPAETPAQVAPVAKLWNVVRRPWVLAFVAVIAFLAAAGVLALATHRGNTQKAAAATAFASQSQTIVASLVPMANRLAASVPASAGRCTWSTSLTAAVRSAGELQSALAQSQDDCAKLEPSNADETSVKQAMMAALTSLATYTGAVANLPAQLSALTTSQAQTVQSDAAAARAACQHLHAIDTAAQPLTVAPYTTLAAEARKASSDVKLRLFLLKVQNDILDQSQYGRQDIVNAVNGVNGMTANPDDAANTMDSVESNRQSLLDQLSAMTVPDDSRAVGVYNLLQQGLQHSIEADRDYAAWMHDVYNYYYEYPIGYMGNVPHTADYNAAVTQSAMANASKGNFCSRYDRLARRLGLRHTWQAAQI